jgi:hypothetical protein
MTDVSQELMIEAGSSSKMLVSIYQTKWCYIPDDSHFIITMRTSNLTKA